MMLNIYRTAKAARQDTMRIHRMIADASHVEMRTATLADHEGKGAAATFATTPAILAKLAKLRTALLNGENPYNKGDEKVETPDAGGSLLDQPIFDEIRASNQKDNLDHQMALEAKWQNRTFTKRVTLSVDMRPATPALAMHGPHHPDYVTCSFCKVDVHRSSITEGRGPLRTTYIDELLTVNGHTFTRRKKIHASDKLAACSNCCLYLVNHVRFPETRG